MDTTTEWLEMDGAPTDAPDGLSLDVAGIEQVTRGRATRASWRDVLGVARASGTVYVLVPRRPPAPPWIEIDPGDRNPAELASEIRTRSERAGYREARIERALLEPRSLLAAVVARQELAGAVEIPARVAPPPRPRYEALWALGGGGAGLIAAVALIVVLEIRYIQSPVTWLGITAGVIAGVLFGRAIHRPPRGRVMVLAPDGIVASLEGQVRAMSWDQVAAVEERAGAVCVTGVDGTTRGLDTKWIDAPIPLLVAIAEAYRVRWSAACSRR